MNADDSKQVLDYPFRPLASLEPPEEWARLRQGCPVAHVRLPSGDEAVLLTRYDDVKQLMSDSRFTHHPTLELDIPAETLPRREGLIVGGLEKVPVRW